jgi:hypothetical protein
VWSTSAVTTADGKARTDQSRLMFREYQQSA